MMGIIKGCSAAFVAAMFLRLSDPVHGLKVHGLYPQTEKRASAPAAGAPADLASGLPDVPIVNPPVPVGTLTLDMSAASNATTRATKTGAARNPNWLYYEGGPVLLTPNVVMIYFTNSKVSSTALGKWVNYANSFVSSLGASSRWAPTKAYYEVVNGVKKYMTGSLNLTASYTIPVSTDYTFSQANIESSLGSWLASGKVANDSNAIYVFATAPGSGLRDNEGFCSYYCGYHWSTRIVGFGDMKYAFVPVPDTCTRGCTAPSSAYGSGKSPTGSAVYDSFFSVLFHELLEAATDPSAYQDAWITPYGDENGDICAWDFGTLSYVTNAFGVKTTYNAMVGGLPYFLQQSYNLVKQACVQ